MTGPLRVGVLGCSSFAVRRMLPAIRETPGMVLTAVASRTASKAESVARQFGAEPITGYQALLDRDTIDAVYVPLPIGLHATWIERALRAGKHVLGEKALTGSYEDTARLTGLAHAGGLCLTENFMFLHHPQHRTVRQWLDAGEIGDPRVLNAAFGIPPRPPDDVRRQRSLGGSALLDIGVYPVRTALLYLPEPLQVLGAVLHMDTETGVDVGGHALLRGDDGATAELSFGFRHAYRSSYEIWGDRGSVRVGRAYTPRPDESPVVCLDRQDGTSERVAAPAHDQAVSMLADFAESALTGRGRVSQASDAVRQAAMIEKIRSVAQREWLSPRPAGSG